MCKSKSYLKSLLTGINLVWVLTIASVMLTGIVASYDFGLFGSVVSSSNALSLAIILAGGFGLATLIYMLCNLKNSEISFADMLAGAFVFVGLFFFAYVFISTGSLNGRRIIAAALLVVVGVVYMLIRAKCKKNEETEKTYENTSIKGYFATIFKKFSLPFIVLLTVAISCFTYLFFSANFVDNYLKGSRVVIAITVLFAMPLVISLFKKIGSKNVNILDALLIPIGAALIFSLISLILKDYSTKKMVVWTILLAVYVLVINNRLTKFDLSEKDATIKPVESDSYANALLGTYNIFDILAISSTMALISAMILRSGIILSGTANGLDVGFLPVFVLIIAIGCVIAYGCISALIGLKKKQIGCGDFWLGVLASFAVCGFISLMIYSSVLLGYMLVIFSVFVLILLLIRAKNLKN